MNNQNKYNENIYCTPYTTNKGSLSNSDTSTETWPSSILNNLSWKISLRYPLSVFECSHNITLVLEWIASSTSWCDISPVIHKSAATFLKTLEPDPAQTAIVLTNFEPTTMIHC